jgi:hypothetical protein
LFDEILEEINILTPFNDTVWNFIEEETNGTFPKRKKIDKICNNNPFQGGPGKDILYITEIGIQADDRLRTGVVDHIFDFERSVDGSYGHHYSPNFLNPEEGDDPLGRVGDIEHDFIAFSHSQVIQSRGKPINKVPQSGIGKLLAQIDDGRSIRIFFDHPLELGESQFGFHHSKAPLQIEKLTLKNQQ